MAKAKRRRPRGTGSITKYGDRYRAFAWIGDERRTSIQPTYQEAWNWIERERKAAPANAGTRPKATLLDLRQEFLDDLKLRVTDRTYAGTRSHLDVTLARWGSERLRDLSLSRIEDILAEMAGLGWAESTRHNRVNTITGLLRYAMRKGIIEARPLPIRRPPITLASRPDPYTHEQAAALLEAAEAEDPRKHAAVLLLLKAGLRASEVMRFQARDLDAARRAIVVPVRSREDRPKSGKERWIPVPESIPRALKSCSTLTVNPRPPFKYPGPPFNDPGPLFNDRGWKSVSSLHRWLESVWAGAGIDGVELHRCRHRWATDVANAGASPFELKEWGGWATLDLVLRYYHGPRADRRGPIDALDGS